MHSFTYIDSDIAGVETNYVPAVYDLSGSTWSVGTTSDVSEATNTFADWSSPTVSANFLDGDYTAGEISAFNDPAQFFSRQSGLWRLTTTWTNDTLVGNAASRIPTDGDVVYQRRRGCQRSVRGRICPLRTMQGILTGGGDRADPFGSA